MTIALEHLIFPERMDDAGREFVAVHGLDAVSLGALRHNAIDKGDGKVMIFHRCQHSKDGLCSIYDSRPEICRTFDCGLRDDCLMRKTHGTVLATIPLVAHGV